MLRYLSEREKVEPGIRERVAAAMLFPFALDMLKEDAGVRVENLLAMLASVAGQECILPIVALVADAAKIDAALTLLGLAVVKGKDCRVYYFGDAPNRLLAESEESVLGLALGAAKALGAAVSFDMIGDEMHKVASRVGGAEFETLDLPRENMVDRPTNWVRFARKPLIEALDVYEVPPNRRAAALGYTIQKAIDAGKHTLDPVIAAQIVLQCATRTAKTIVS